MSRLPLRARLTVVFVAVMGVVLVVIGSFLYYRTKHNLDTSILQSLRAREGAARSYAQAARRDRSGLIPPGERFAQILAPDGRVLAGRPQARRPLLTAAQTATAARGPRVFELHERERYLAGPARVNGAAVVVVVAASLAQRERAMESLAGALLVGGPLALLLAGAVAYAIAAGALRPVEDMRSRAATIGRADAAARLPVPAVEDELRRLSLTLNEMLGRIGRAAEHERRFIANASHELRTPLAALQAELELAERHAASAAELRDAIGRGRRDVARLIDLSNGLLDLAAVDEGRPATTEAVDVDELLRDVVAQRRHRAAAQGRELLVRPSGLTVAADAPAVRRALGNLVDNALVHGAGEVSVGADSGAGGGCIELWVHDEGALGAGVRPEQAFERFARGPDARNRPGAGLGLALVRGVAQAHGGSAELVDEPGGGVRAVLRLPADRS